MFIIFKVKEAAAKIIANSILLIWSTLKNMSPIEIDQLK